MDFTYRKKLSSTAIKKGFSCARYALARCSACGHNCGENQEIALKRFDKGANFRDDNICQETYCVDCFWKLFDQKKI